MKRLFIIQQASTAMKYGVGTYCEQLVSCFDLQEWQITVVELFSLNQHLVEEEREGIHYYQIPVCKEYNWTPMNRTKYERGIFYLLAAETFADDSIFCHFNFVYDYDLAMLFKERLHAKIVLTVHYMEWSFDLLGDRDRFQTILKNPVNLEDQNIVKRFETEKRFMLECCDRVIAIAKHSYDTLRDLYCIPTTKLACIPNGIKDGYVEWTNEERSILRKKYGFREDEKLVIFAGRLNLVKGIIELIQAFKLVMEEVADIRLIVAGNECFQTCFEAAAPCWADITFTGFIPKKQLFELYAISDVGVVPSLHEEFGYVAVEMMMNDLPLIVSDTTGLREVTGEGQCALLVDMTQKEQRIENLKQGIVKWLSANCSFDSGRERFKREYDIERFKERIKLLYRLNNS